MPSITTKACIVLLAAGTACTAAGATDLLLEQAPPASESSSEISTGSNPSYDDFRLAGDSEVTSVTWWAPSFSPSSGSFTISFTGASGFYPDLGDVLYTATVTATGVTSNGLTRFDADLPTAAVLPGLTNLFLSIADVTPNAFYYWSMAPHAASPGSLPAGISVTYNSPSPTLQGQDLAWALDGDPYVAPAPSVPEPAAWAMMTIGFGLVGGALRGRKRTAIRFA